MTTLKKLLITAMLVAVYLLHQDFWNWNKNTVVFGFLPAGLAYHAGYSLLASAMMAILVECAWPKHLEDTKPVNPDQKTDKE